MRDAQGFSREQALAVLTALPDPAFILTRSGRYASIFGGSDLRYYHDSTGLVGKTLYDVLSAEKSAYFLSEIERALSTGKLHVVEYGLGRGDIKGSTAEGPEDPIWFEGRIRALNFPVEGEDAVLWVASNITERNDLEIKLRAQSERDSLSGLYNRRKLMSALAEHYDLFARYKRPTSLLIFDIDHFKRINDDYGHLIGDKAIVTVAEVCRRELRATDLPARLGGDEFVVLMPHTARDNALIISDRLRQRIGEALASLGTGGTISGGLGEFQPADTSNDDVLKRADEGLYQVKRGGRNRIALA